VDGNSPVGIVTHYRLDGLGIECWWVQQFSATIHTDRQAHPTLYAVSIVSLSWGKSSWGVALTTHLQPIIKFKERVELYLYSSSVPSWPIIG